MGTALALLEIVLPVFLVIGLGYAAARTRFLAEDVIDALTSYGVRVATPALLFLALLRLDLGQAVDWRALLAFFATINISFFTAMALSRKFWQRRPGEAVAIGFAACFGNTVMLGVPIAERAYGAEVVAAVFGLIALHSAHNYFLGFITMEMVRADGTSFWEGLRRAFATTISNPLIWSLAALPLNLARAPLPEMLVEGLDMLAATAIPVSLFSLGGVLTRYRLRDEIGEALMISSMTLLAMPAIAWVLTAFVLGLAPEFVRAVVILTAMPSGVNGYIFATLYGRAVGTAASAVLLGTILSLGTITFWLGLLALWS